MGAESGKAKFCGRQRSGQAHLGKLRNTLRWAASPGAAARPAPLACYGLGLCPPPCPRPAPPTWPLTKQEYGWPCMLKVTGCCTSLAAAPARASAASRRSVPYPARAGVQPLRAGAFCAGIPCWTAHGAGTPGVARTEGGAGRAKGGAGRAMSSSGAVLQAATHRLHDNGCHHLLHECIGGAAQGAPEGAGQGVLQATKCAGVGGRLGACRQDHVGPVQLPRLQTCEMGRACARRMKRRPAGATHLTSRSARLPGARKMWSTRRGICAGAAGRGAPLRAAAVAAGGRRPCAAAVLGSVPAAGLHGGNQTIGTRLEPRHCCGAARPRLHQKVPVLCQQQQLARGGGLAGGCVVHAQRHKALDRGKGHAPAVEQPILRSAWVEGSGGEPVRHLGRPALGGSLAPLPHQPPRRRSGAPS